MKKLLIIVSFIAFSVSNSIAQDHIEFFQGTFEEAIALSKKQGKPLFIDAYASWCGPCKMMSRSVFTNSDVAEFFNGNFINMKIDMERGEGPKIRGKYGVRAYPTLLFVGSDKQVLKKAVGYHKPASLIELGKRVINN